MTAHTDRIRAEQACAEGESALTRGDRETAERHFRVALALAGEGPVDEGLAGEGEAPVDGNPENAKPDSENPGSDEAVARVVARARTGVGRVRLAGGEVAEAVGEFERAREVRPGAAGPLHWLGCAAAHRGDLDAAERCLTEALACPVPHPRSLVQRAYVHVRAGRPAAARTDLRAAARTGPLDEEARWVLAALSGRPAREVGLRLLAAAVARAEGRDGVDERVGALAGAARGFGADLSGFGPLYAVLLVLGGRREDAVALLRDAARREPADHRVTHTLALVLLNSLGGDGRSSWESCVAAWAALLYDDGFWERVRASAARRYGVVVEHALLPGVRSGLRELLERRMPEEDSGTRVAPGPLLRREADAAKLLAGAGGLPSDGRGGAPLFCGPLRVAELGRTAEFGAFAAAREARALQEGVPVADAGTPATATAPTSSTYTSMTYTSLTYAFSELGFAQLLLGQDKAADALAALTELRCPDCRTRGGGPGTAAVCEPGCARFDELNPGYAGLPDRHRRLALDARGLALEARLSMGRSELGAQRPDFGAAAACWRRALVHSRELERYRETQTAIVDMALGAARDAHRAGRLSLAVATLETTRSVIGANERGRLEGQLARVLADRGISVANDETALLDEPAADLRRSVAFNPHLLRAQVSLGIVLRGLAAARWSSGSLSGARDTLREAIDQLTAALVHFPDDPDLEEQREAAVADLDHVMWQPDESGA
ncbi:hypothetical protein ACFWZ2_37945 [Streptomyces sp. NPDC059002]|uniref:hypothetical protein n=1 Tax=Streptomyces sp. NPDC059002 TaxID=3346690 RepID=UPI0036942810